MSMQGRAQFTPGPWVVTEHSAGMICVAGPDHKDLCAVGYNRTEGRNDVANANLIAAAPAMYEALQATLAYFLRSKQTHAPEVQIIRQAIAQAEGRQA